MTLARALQSLDDLVHSPVRFALMSALNSVDQADYQTIKESRPQLRAPHQARDNSRTRRIPPRDEGILVQIAADELCAHRQGTIRLQGPSRRPGRTRRRPE